MGVVGGLADWLFVFLIDVAVLSFLLAVVFFFCACYARRRALRAQSTENATSSTPTTASAISHATDERTTATATETVELEDVERAAGGEDHRHADVRRPVLAMSLSFADRERLRRESEQQERELEGANTERLEHIWAGKVAARLRSASAPLDTSSLSHSPAALRSGASEREQSSHSDSDDSREQDADSVATEQLEQLWAERVHAKLHDGRPETAEKIASTASRKSESNVRPSISEEQHGDAAVESPPSASDADRWPEELVRHSQWHRAWQPMLDAQGITRPQDLDHLDADDIDQVADDNRWPYALASIVSAVRDSRRNV